MIYVQLNFGGNASKDNDDTFENTRIENKNIIMKLIMNI